MIDGMRYIGIGEYGIFEDDLKELMEAKVIVSVANELGLFDGVDFAAITDRGSVVISGTLGPFLKVNDGYWVRTAPAVPKKLWSDLDLVNELINEYEDNDYIATVIDPGLE